MQERYLLVRDARVVDAVRHEPTTSTCVLVRGERIVAVGDEERLRGLVEREALATMEIVEGNGRYLMPGLIDAHVHMTYGNSYTQEEQDLYTSVEMRTLYASRNVTRVLRAGVTSISEPGSSFYIGVAIREAIEAGMLVGPRMKAAGRYITTSNGLTDFYPESVGVPDSSIGMLANTLDQMRDAVRRQVKNGVDLIKLADSPYGQYQAFSGDEMKSVAELVHQLGRKVTIHARGSAEVGAAVDAGIDWIMHGNIMSDAVIEKLAASRIPLVPTLTFLANAVDYADLVGTSPRFRDGAARLLETTADSLHRAHAAGVVFGVGTDTGFALAPYGEWHGRELQLLVDYAGLTPREALQAATIDCACTVGRAGELGEIREGMLADMLLVAQNPLRDVSFLADPDNIEVVIAGGRRVDFDGTEELLWPNDRAKIYSVRTLTHDVVEGGTSAGTVPSLAAWESVPEAKEVAREIGRLGERVATSERDRVRAEKDER